MRGGWDFPPPAITPLAMSNASLDAPSNPSRPIWPHQFTAYSKLLALARTCLGAQRNTLPVKLRTTSLLLGPTGSGKTFLAETIAAEIGAAFFPLALSNWIILGARDHSSQTTWVSIVDFLRRNHNSTAFIFCDEFEKAISHRHLDTWSSHLRVELFQLLDRKIPKNLKDADGNVIGPAIHAAAQDTLENRTFIVAAATFQDLWETRSRSNIGFGNPSQVTLGPSPDELGKELPREILNRFRHDHLVLPELNQADYETMLESTAARVPIYLRQTFLRLGYEKIPAAIAMRQGCRFVEDLMTDTLLAERACLQKISVQPEKHEDQRQVTSIEQDGDSF
ncbi:hypothetical protein BH09VER1_BH09VER1_53050 [soil metagenome]